MVYYNKIIKYKTNAMKKLNGFKSIKSSFKFIIQKRVLNMLKMEFQ